MTQIAFESNIGPREELQDVGRAFTVKAGVTGEFDVTVLLVLDGAGGCAGGAVASAMARDSIATDLFFHFLSGEGDNREAILEAMAQAFLNANRLILQQAGADSCLTGMATTAVCVVVLQDTLYVAWIGDSRCFLHADETLTQVTRDHSQVEELIALGLLDRAESKSHPSAHCLTRYLGMQDGFQVEARVLPIRHGDIVLLSTDGLTDVLSNDEIAQFITGLSGRALSFEEWPKQLVGEALSRGTRDNTTVMCYRHISERHYVKNQNRTATGDYAVVVAQELNRIFVEV